MKKLSRVIFDMIFKVYWVSVFLVLFVIFLYVIIIWYGILVGWGDGGNFIVYYFIYFLICIYYLF